MRKIHFLYILFFIGLAIKIYALFFNGTCDMRTYARWGTAVMNKGLKEGYQGIYFPFQYQIFSLAEFLYQRVNLFPYSYTAHKAISLFFDISNFILLIQIFKRYSINIFYASLYWILPWFLNIFWLGYIDFHFTFFILLFIYFYKDGEEKPLQYFLYGIPLGLAFFMKPQVQALIVLLSIYQLVIFYRKRKITQMFVFLPSFLLYGIYCLVIGWKPLTYAYIHTADVMPALTAYMLNFWYPIAYLLKLPSENVTAIPDTIITIFHIPVLRVAAILFIISFSSLFIYKLKESKHNILYIFTLCSLLVPFIMTNAHENHLFLGTVLLCICIPLFKEKVFTICSISLICIQQINIYCYYQLGENKFFVADTTIYFTWHIGFILSIVSYFLFGAIFWTMIRRCTSMAKENI